MGNGDPSCHEPDVFVPEVPTRRIVVNEWRWKLAKIPHNRGAIPEYANDFDDSAWNTLDAKTSGGELTIKTPDTTAIYRAHFTLTEEDLKGAGAQICFGGCDDEGWYFVNGQFIGESHDWQAQPIFDIKKFIHAGDNVDRCGRQQRCRSGRPASQCERGSHRQNEHAAVVAQPVQRSGANHRAIHVRSRRIQIDRQFRRPQTDNGRGARFALHAVTVRGINR